MNLFKARRKNQLLRIGHNSDGDTLSIPYAAREAHLHVIGRTRSGKSRFLTDLITQDLKYGLGTCVLDPHSELFDYLISWLARNPLVAKRRRIHPVDFSDKEHAFAFNPLHINEPDEAFGVAEAVVQALTRIFGGSQATETPLIDATLMTTFVMLAERGLPLAAAPYFLIEHHKEVRTQLVQGHPDPYWRDLGHALNNLSGKRFEEETKAALRRVNKLLGNPMVRRVFSVTENTIDFRHAMDRGDVLLFNLRARKKNMGRQQMRAIGTLLTNTLVSSAFERDPRDKPRPFYLYIDEVQNYISDDIEEILSEASKLGLFLTLSHQYPGQLREQSEKIHQAIMTNTLLKAVFALPFEQSMEFVDDLFADQIDPERVKEKLATPHQVGHQVTAMATYSETEGTSDSLTETVGQSVGQSIAASRGHGTSTSETESFGFTDGVSENEVEAFGDSTSPLFAQRRPLRGPRSKATKSDRRN